MCVCVCVCMKGAAASTLRVDTEIIVTCHLEQKQQQDGVTVGRGEGEAVEALLQFGSAFGPMKNSCHLHSIKIGMCRRRCWRHTNTCIHIDYTNHKLTKIHTATLPHGHMAPYAGDSS